MINLDFSGGTFLVLLADHLHVQLAVLPWRYAAEIGFAKSLHSSAYYSKKLRMVYFGIFVWLLKTVL